MCAARPVDQRQGDPLGVLKIARNIQGSLELGRRTVQCTLEKCHVPEDNECPGDAPFVPLLAERRQALFDDGSSPLAVSLRNGDAPQHEEREGGTRLIAQIPVQGETFFEQRVAPPEFSLEVGQPPGTDQYLGTRGSGATI